MKKIQTKSGFVWNVEEKKVADWDFVTGLIDLEDDNEGKRIKALHFVVVFLLGEDGAAALAEHVKDKNGIKSVGRIMEEFKEILGLLNEEAKKS
jgi:hypothetical protein